MIIRPLAVGSHFPLFPREVYTRIPNFRKINFRPRQKIGTLNGYTGHIPPLKFPPLTTGFPMLRFWDHDSRRHRREFLQVGGLGLGGLQLTSLFQARADTATLSSPIVKDKAVIFLFLHGGPSQRETFDPRIWDRCTLGLLARIVRAVDFPPTSRCFRRR